jgi:hypothetical protein
MSLSVSGSSANNPLAYLQSMWQQASSAGNSSSSSDPLSALLAELGQQGSGTASAASGTASSITGAMATTGGTSAQFNPQTLQALLALQGNGSSAQSLESQFDNGADGDDPMSALQSGQSQGGHHHHHSMDATGSDSSSNSAAADTTNSSSGGSNGTGNNLLNQLMQIQAQLVSPPAQSVTTA